MGDRSQSRRPDNPRRTLERLLQMRGLMEFLMTRLFLKTENLNKDRTNESTRQPEFDDEARPVTGATIGLKFEF